MLLALWPLVDALADAPLVGPAYAYVEVDASAAGALEVEPTATAELSEAP